MGHVVIGVVAYNMTFGNHTNQRLLIHGNLKTFILYLYVYTHLFRLTVCGLSSWRLSELMKNVALTPTWRERKSLMIYFLTTSKGNFGLIYKNSGIFCKRCFIYKSYIGIWTPRISPTRLFPQKSLILSASPMFLPFFGLLWHISHWYSYALEPVPR